LCRFIVDARRAVRAQVFAATQVERDGILSDVLRNRPMRAALSASLLKRGAALFGLRP
jgi:hypothetical protein